MILVKIRRQRVQKAFYPLKPSYCRRFYLLTIAHSRAVLSLPESLIHIRAPQHEQESEPASCPRGELREEEGRDHTESRLDVLQCQVLGRGAAGHGKHGDPEYICRYK